MVFDQPIYGGDLGRACACSSPDCWRNGCAIARRSQQAQQQDGNYEALRRLMEGPRPTVPEIDYERLADLIAERLKRPPGYQG